MIGEKKARQKRIFINMVSLAVAMVFLCTVSMAYTLYTYFGEIVEEDLVKKADVIQEELADYGRILLTPEEDCRVTLVDEDGKVIYDSIKNPAEMENHKDRQEVAQAFAEGEGRATRHSDTIAEETIYYARLLEDGTVLRVAKEQNQVPQLLKGMIIPMAIIVLIAVIIALAISRKAAGSVASDIDHEEKEEREILRREFTSNVSHELKTPLTTIYGVSDMMAQGIVREEDVPRFAGNIRDEAERMRTLIDDIIKLSRLDEIEEGQTGDEIDETVDLLAQAKDVARRLHMKASENNISITVEGERVCARGRQALVNDVIYNLCENAIKYNKPQGKVIIRTGIAEGESKGDLVEIAVSDTGLGIGEEDKDRVFERFYRGDKSRSQSVEGTGLGLSIVKHSVASMGGTVSLDSVLGRGTTFTVTLPRANQIP